jgi:threonine dehydrogenase-like Zn-dependent dehydrogenase
VGDRITAISAAGCGHCLACLNGQYLLCEKGPLPYAGGFADYMRVHTMSAARLPDSLSFGDGALVEPLAVGLHGVAMAALTPGTPVLVLGAGAISLAAIYWARRLGAGRIVVMSRSARRAEMALKMGADQFVQMGENELEEVRAAFGGRAPEVVFEGIGVVGALQQSANHVAVNGRIISLGFCTQPDSVLPAIATFKQITIGFSMAYSMREFEWCANALDRGHVPVEALISRVIPLEQVPDTIVQLRAGGGSDIKIQADMSL